MCFNLLNYLVQSEANVSLNAKHFSQGVLVNGSFQVTVKRALNHLQEFLVIILNINLN